jgi:hypothetical protein
MSFLKAMGLSDEQRSELRERQDMAINGELRMCDEERLLTDDQKKRAWDLLYQCLEWGSENSRPILMDQSKLIVLVDKLLKEKKTK